MTSRLDTRAAGDRRRTRTYLIEFAAGMVAYAVVLAASIPLAKASPAGPGRWVLAALPLIPVAWVAVAVLRHLRRIDELQQRQLVEGLATGFVVAMLTAVGLGLLEPAGLTVPGAPWWIYAAGMLAWALTALVQRRR